MTLDERLHRFAQIQKQNSAEQITAMAPVSLFTGATRFAILDGEVVEVFGFQPDYPKMSPVWWINVPTIDGHTETLPISVNDRDLQLLTPAQELRALRLTGQTGQTAGRIK